jgi:hypothetical protein
MERRHVNPFERNLYEDVMKAVEKGAAHLAEAGRTEDAIAVYKALAAKYPRSLVCGRCEKALATISPK